MNTIKQEAHELIQKLPDNCTFEDIKCYTHNYYKKIDFAKVF